MRKILVKRHCFRIQRRLSLEVSNNCTMGCPPVRGDNPRALAITLRTGGQTWNNYFIPNTSV